MSIDLQVAFPQEQIQLNNVRIIAGPPRTLDIIGTDFSSVDEVLINDIASPSVIVLSKTRLIAQVPTVLAKSGALLSISVLSRRLTITPRSIIRFKFGNTPGRTRGILRLVQLFLKILFTTPTTDIFNPAIGGGALKNLGSTFSSDEGADIIGDFHIAVSNTIRQIVAIQSRNPAIPRDERLLSAKVLKAGFNKNEGALVVSVEITSQAGRAALINSEL